MVPYLINAESHDRYSFFNQLKSLDDIRPKTAKAYVGFRLVDQLHQRLENGFALLAIWEGIDICQEIDESWWIHRNPHSWNSDTLWHGILITRPSWGILGPLVKCQGHQQLDHNFLLVRRVDAESWPALKTNICDMGVSIAMAVPNSWMVFVRENPTKMDDDWGGTPMTQETPTCDQIDRHFRKKSCFLGVPAKFWRCLEQSLTSSRRYQPLQNPQLLLLGFPHLVHPQRRRWRRWELLPGGRTNTEPQDVVEKLEALDFKMFKSSVTNARDPDAGLKNRMDFAKGPSQQKMSPLHTHSLVRSQHVQG